MNLTASLIGYHNPRKHRGLSPRQFLSAWVVGQLRRLHKEEGSERKENLIEVIRHWEDYLNEVSRLFPQTLNLNLSRTASKPPREGSQGTAKPSLSLLDKQCTHSDDGETVKSRLDAPQERLLDCTVKFPK